MDRLGRQLLAGAGLSGDEDRDVGGRQPGQALEDLAHRHTLSEQRREPGLGRDRQGDRGVHRLERDAGISEPEGDLAIGRDLPDRDVIEEDAIG